MIGNILLDTPVIHINTLGNFDIKIGEKSILEKSSKSYKTLELFKYFLAFKEKRLLPEAIIDQLWPDNDSSDPKNILRTQIFRLRRFFDEDYIKDDMEKYININFVGGYYILKLGPLVSYDAADFEELIKEANKTKVVDPKRAIILYKEAIKLYKGNYLEEDAYSEWIVPLRNHYNRIHLQALFDLIELLKEQIAYLQIIDICEEALKIERTEEVLHIYFMEALLKTGQVKHAMSHYDYSTALLGKELGVKPSNAMRNMQRKIQSYNEENGEADINSLDRSFEEDKEKGALYCDVEYFRFMYNISKRRCERQTEVDYLGLASLSTATGQITEGMHILKEVLHNSLRRNDIYSNWNDSQLTFILNNPKESKLGDIEKRILDSFYKKAGNKKFTLKIKFREITNEYELAL